MVVEIRRFSPVSFGFNFLVFVGVLLLTIALAKVTRQPCNPTLLAIEGGLLFLINEIRSLLKPKLGKPDQEAPEQELSLPQSSKDYLYQPKNLQEALLEAHQTLQALVNACPLGITLFTLDGTVKLWNPAAEKIFGWTASEAIGEFLPVIPVVKRDEFLANLELIRQGHSLFDIEVRRQNKSGELIDVKLWAAPVRDSEGNMSCMSIVADVTELKQIEAERQRLVVREQAVQAKSKQTEETLLQNEERLRIALQNEQAARMSAERAYKEVEAANRLKDEFLATLSHELRTPLGLVLGWTQMLQQRRLNAVNTTRALETIDRNMRSLSRVIEDLLDISRIITHDVRLNLRPVEIGSVVAAAIAEVQPAVTAKNIDLKRHFTPCNGIVMGDSYRLQQVVRNLLVNAVKFTPDGGQIEVRLEPERIEPDRQKTGQKTEAGFPSNMQIIVSDTGKGISPDFLPFVFDHFRQADSSLTRPHGGLGLGMAIVHHLVQLHNGTVTATSPGEGRGATFTVKLPLLGKTSQGSAFSKNAKFHRLQTTPQI
jgi:PAS domain S-box-containing protein